MPGSNQCRKFNGGERAGGILLLLKALPFVTALWALLQRQAELVGPVWIAFQGQHFSTVDRRVSQFELVEPNIWPF